MSDLLRQLAALEAHVDAVLKENEHLKHLLAEVTVEVVAARKQWNELGERERQ